MNSKLANQLYTVPQRASLRLPAFPWLGAASIAHDLSSLVKPGAIK